MKSTLTDFSSPAVAVNPLQLSSAPIGVFDSGMGGLSIVQELQAYLPQESIIYLADTKHVPYGERSDDEICQLTTQAVQWLHAQGCKAVVIACNTASAFSLTPLREHYGPGFPIIGLVPAVKPAVLKSRSKVVGVLATPGTLRGSLLKDVIAEVAVPAQVQVLTAISPALVPFVEQGQQDSKACQQELERILRPLQQAGADHLVLGCTHYPFLKNSIRAVFGEQFVLVDSGLAVARQTGRVLTAQRLNNGQIQTAGTEIESAKQPVVKLQCYVTGNANMAQPVLNSLIKSFSPVFISVQQADIESMAASCVAQN
ncbi:glutamate racemase [Alkanindiges illinoisensis]|uniref:glutamate racemase n=1 Tax=Alkanindiges illinoisensis TaxID=197183 RepID=UPI0006849639|nr:glutamate racemase [Alkanindiges illinoisensis]